VVVLNRTVGEVASVVSDNVRAIKKATEHLIGLRHASICYLGGPEASYANGIRWRGLKEAGHELDLQVRRIGPFLPTIRGGADAAERWGEAIAGGFAPTGRLPLTFPIDEAAIAVDEHALCASPTDVPGCDKERCVGGRPYVHTDSDGNCYELGHRLTLEP